MSGYTVYYTYPSACHLSQTRTSSPVLSYPFHWSTPEELKAYIIRSIQLRGSMDSLDKRRFRVWSLISNVDDHRDPPYCDHRLLISITSREGWVGDGLTFAILLISFWSKRHGCNELVLTLMLRWTYLLFRLRMPLCMYVIDGRLDTAIEWPSSSQNLINSEILPRHGLLTGATPCTIHLRLSRSLVR